MAKINIEKLDQYVDQEEKVEKIHNKRKISTPSKKHIKKESKHKVSVDWNKYQDTEE